MNIKQEVADYITAKTAQGKWTTPPLQDALCFLVTEVDEALEAYMRTKPEYVRNDPTKKYDLGKELADVVLMAFVCAQVGGFDIETELAITLSTTRR